MTTAASPFSRADHAASVAQSALRLWDHLQSVVLDRLPPTDPRDFPLPDEVTPCRHVPGNVTLAWDTPDHGHCLVAHVGPAGSALLAFDLARSFNVMAPRPNDPVPTGMEFPANRIADLLRFASDRSPSASDLARFRRDCERAAKGEGPAGRAVDCEGIDDRPAASLGGPPLATPPPITSTPTPPTPPAASPHMPPDITSAYAARKAEVDDTLPIARRAIKDSRGQFKGGVGGVLIGMLITFLIKNLPLLIEIIRDSLKARELAASNGGAMTGDGADAAVMNSAVRRAIRDIRDGVVERD